MSEQDNFMGIFLMVGVVLLFLTIVATDDAGMNSYEEGMYYSGIDHHTIFEFDTKNQAKLAVNYAEQNNASAWVMDPIGILWYRRWPVQISGGYEDHGHYLQELPPPFRWNETIGLNIISRVTRK